ncbi:MAG: hypothetical protein ROZ37_13270 [Aromatoleum sp.]|uniref:hypothetical protein n=1 Tax=Aromatoleum sp. TaxID=2307007 RepID=UPI0028947DD3|nr:hypothetical protein [Aromatoleum sp.]MDT3671288.1 hypothetical protein [Aromatoleum sp.]
MSHDFLYDATQRLDAADPWAPARQRPDPCAEDCTPRCPACGGLKCLCRPRFFPGQLLTDDDLNRLEQYVIDKNRLHNRYLHGWGVACGLEVGCDPCAPGHVIVRTGYAVSPCGDDIVVCADQSVDICALINTCAPTRQPVCDPPYDTPPQDCSGKAREWVLAICYDERPVRGITAQLGMSDTPCGTRCACGGSGSCGCAGCNGTATGQSGDCSCAPKTAATPPPRRKTYAPQCEPTQVCEGYRFVAYPAPKPAKMPDPAGGRSGELIWAWLYANRARFGPLLERLLCCVTRAMELRAAIREGQALDVTASLSVYTDYAAALQEFAADFSLHRCTFVSRVQRQYDDARDFVHRVGQPRALTKNQVQQLKGHVLALDSTWLDILSECFCSALLPACPPPAPDNCVPLAVVTVGGDTCRVVEICNWEARKILVTWRTVMYWLSWLPWQRLRKWIADLCCGDERERSVYRLLMLMIGVAFSGQQAAAAPRMARMARMAGPRGAAGAAAETGGDPLADALGADHLLDFMLKDYASLRSEGAASTQHPLWAALLARASDASALAPLAGAPPEVGDLSRKLAELERLVAAQQKQINELSKR